MSELNQHPRARQLTAEHKEWMSDLIEWRRQTRDAIDMLLAVQQWLLKQSDLISEHETKIHKHHFSLAGDGESAHDATVHAQVREIHQRLKRTLPDSLAGFSEALRALHLKMLD